MRFIRRPGIALGFALVFWLSLPFAGVAQLVGGRDTALVYPGSPAPIALSVETNARPELDLIVGTHWAAKIGAFKYSLFVVGGPLEVPLLRDQPLDCTFAKESDTSWRGHFQMPAIEARAGSHLRLTIKSPEQPAPVIEALLEVTPAFDPSDLRRWFAAHPVAVDPALKGVVDAFTAWDIPKTEMGDAPIALVSPESKLSPHAAAILSLTLAKNGRTRIIVLPIDTAPIHIEAELPSTRTFIYDRAARDDLIAALYETAKAANLAQDFPSL